MDSSSAGSVRGRDELGSLEPVSVGLLSLLNDEGTEDLGSVAALGNIDIDGFSNRDMSEGCLGVLLWARALCCAAVSKARRGTNVRVGVLEPDFGSKCGGGGLPPFGGPAGLED